MKLTQLCPRFMKYEEGIAGKNHGRKLPDGTTQWGGFPIDTFVPVQTLKEAHLLKLLCPKCLTANGGAKGTHSVHVYFENTPTPDRINNGVRWKVSGTDFHDLTIQPSILCQGGCNWHGFITAGDVSII